MSPTNNPLISADELRVQLGGVRVIDVRWYLDDHAKGRRAYEAGHVPGAVFVDVERDITGVDGAGRHPLPTREQFETAMRRAGVGSGDRVVIYDDASGSTAARLWWLLRIHGHDDAAVLDGGIQAWDAPRERDGRTDAGRLRRGRRRPQGHPLLRGRHDAWRRRRVVGRPGARAVPRRGRAGRSDRGTRPGREERFWKDTLLGDDGRFLPAEELRSRLLAAGARDGETAVYCGSGVVAPQTLLALEVAGLGPVRIYAGGWSDWSKREGASVATGER